MDEPFALLYADPPWSFVVRDRATGLGRAPDAHYGTLETAAIGAFLEEHALAVADNAVLVMWVYDPMLPQAFEVARAWGFEFVTVAFRWLKTRDDQRELFGEDRLAFGLGYHTRGGGCEEAFLFKRGRGLPVLRHDIRKEFYAQRREHSRKPGRVRGWLEQLYGDVPRVELFARETAPGWAAIGTETDKFGRAA